MLSELFSNHGSAICLGILLCLVVWRVISSSRKSRKKIPVDPPSIFGPIRGMYVCYQCDTIFNTTQCPGCYEDAVIPLIHLTGSIMEDERVAAVIGRLQERNGWKLWNFQDGQKVTLAPASMPASSNGDAPAITVRLPALRLKEVRNMID